jgi:hypothetical protein
MITSTELSGKRDALDFSLQKLDISSSGPPLVLSAARAWRLLVALECRAGRDVDVDLGAVVDADRRRRLACTGTAVATGDGRMIAATD